MALFRRKPRSGQHFIIIFDIGSGSIGGSFVKVDDNTLPEIIFSTRYDIPFQDKLNFERFLELMIKTLEQLFEAMQKAGQGVRVDRAFCVLASPWYASQTRIVHLDQEKTFEVTDKIINKLVQKETELFKNSKLFAQSKVGVTPPEIMEVKNIQVKLNGYEVRNPLGKQASSLEIALYISMIPSNIKKSINESIMRFWHVPPPTFSSFSFTAFDTIRDIFINDRSFLFVDVAGEVTDISLAKDNVLLESLSFPAGKNTLLRRIMDEFKTNYSSASSELSMYTEGRSNLDHQKRIEAVIEAGTNEWRAFFEKALAQFAAEFPIPKTVFFAADENVVKIFEDTMKSSSLVLYSNEENSFVVRSLGFAFLSKFVQILEPNFHDEFLSIETIFANKYIKLAKNSSI